MSVAIRLPSRMATITFRSIMAIDSSSFSMAFLLATTTGSRAGACAQTTPVKHKRATIDRKAIKLMYTALDCCRLVGAASFVLEAGSAGAGGVATRLRRYADGLLSFGGFGSWNKRSQFRFGGR